jgi:Rieske Fe-S protein
MTTNTTAETVKTSKGKDIDKGILWKPISNRTEFIASDSLRYEFVDFFPKRNLVRLWEIDKNDKNLKTLKVFGYDYFSIEDLKTMGVWDILSDEKKKKIVESGIVQAQAQITLNQTDKMAHARKHRASSSEYVGIPREVTCCKCGGTKAIAPALVIKRSTLKKITPEEYAKGYVCLECNPNQRGRKANPKYANLPKEIKCNHPDCKFVQKQHPSMTEKLADAKGVTFSEYVAAWKCKEHRVKKVHHFTQERLDREARGEVKAPKTAKKREGEGKRRGRVANPAFEGIAKELTCNHEGCTVKQNQHPSISIKAAEGKGITLDKYFGSWKCKEHREKKVHHMSKEGREIRKQESAKAEKSKKK